MAIDFIEAGVGQCAIEPAIKRRFTRIEGGAPRSMGVRQVRVNRRAARGIETHPARLSVVIPDPSARLAQRRLEPVQFATGDVTMKCTRIALAGRSGGFPGGSGRVRIDVRLRGRNGNGLVRHDDLQPPKPI